MTAQEGRVVDMYVDTCNGLMVRFAHGGHRRVNDEERRAMLEALQALHPSHPEPK